MSNPIITLRADLVKRLETLAERQGRLLNEVVGDMLTTFVPPPSGNWALAVAEHMEAADIHWIDNPDE